MPPKPNIVYHGYVKYDTETAEKFCEYLESGMSIKNACKQPGMPMRATIVRWRRENEDFNDMFQAAYDNGTDVKAEEIEEEIDKIVEEVRYFDDNKLANAFVNMQKERFHNKRYILGVRNPKKYSMKPQAEAWDQNKPVAVNVTLDIAKEKENPAPVLKKEDEIKQ